MSIRVSMFRRSAGRFFTKFTSKITKLKDEHDKMNRDSIRLKEKRIAGNRENSRSIPPASGLQREESREKRLKACPNFGGGNHKAGRRGEKRIPKLRHNAREKLSINCPPRVASRERPALSCSLRDIAALLGESVRAGISRVSFNVSRFEERRREKKQPRNNRPRFHLRSRKRARRAFARRRKEKRRSKID